MKLAVSFFAVIALLTGCRDLLKDKPTDADVVGVWTATRVDPVVQEYLGERRFADASRFEVKPNGTVAVVNVPTAIAAGRATVIDTAGKWRIIPSKNLGGEVLWHFWLILDEPKRVLNYTFHKDKFGIYLHEAFDLDSNHGIAFRKKPNKAPEPTPGSVTPRATERLSK